MPVYNAEKYLAYSVMSVINQTYKNLEIILIDDNSQDASVEICDSFGKKDTRIRVIHNEKSLGAAGARNIGLNLYNGEYLAFVDADDYVHPRFIELLYSAIRDNNADISCSGFTRTYKIKQNYREISKVNTKLISGIEAALNIVSRKSMFYVVFWNKLFKRNIWKDLRLPTGKRAEDFYTSYMFLSKAEKIALIDANLYFYVQQKSSVMHMHDDFSVYMEEALDGFDRFIESEISDSKLKRYQELSLIFRTDTVVEDYWKACKKGDKKRQEETISRAYVLREEMLQRDIPLRLKFRLFYTNLILYKIGRKLIELKETVQIFFNMDGEGIL